MKKSDELKAQLQEIKNKAENLTKAEDIKNSIQEIKDLKAQIELAEMQEADAKAKAENEINNKTAKTVGQEPKEDINNLQIKVFAKVMSGRQMETDEEIKALSSLTDKDGKLLIPVDIRTAINTWLRNYQDMAQYVSMESTSTISGSRVYEVTAETVPFENVAELTTIPSIGSPEFQKIEYACNYYKGLLEIPNELLKNETGGLMAYISQWIAKKMVCSRNIMAFYANGTKADGLLGMTSGGITVKKDLTAPFTMKYLDTLLNVTLPMSISASGECRIYTNQDGFNYMLSWEDKQGRRYLQEDVTNPGTYRYAGKTIVVFDNGQLKTETIATKKQFPVIVGNLKETMKMFELESFQVETDRSIGFKNDTTCMRVIGALTTKLFDKEAATAFYSPLE